MQRDPNLVRLSHDHHSGLVLAKRARELATAEGAERRVVWAEIQTRFVDEVAGHFELEERGLLAALRVAGQDALVERTLTEHAELRALILSETPEAQSRFGDLLTAHIRFEERILFETAQQVLEPSVLADLGALHHRAARPSCPARSRKGAAHGAVR